jgi:hypothetical protein
MRSIPKLRSDRDRRNIDAIRARSAKPLLQMTVALSADRSRRHSDMDVMAASQRSRRSAISKVVDGQVIGGIGASFGTPEHDVQITQAGLAALNH